MPSVWFTTIAELLTYGATPLSGAREYCAVHAGAGLLAVLPWLDALHVWVVCGS